MGFHSQKIMLKLATKESRKRTAYTATGGRDKLGFIFLL
jgi:hypothetical protein